MSRLLIRHPDGTRADIDQGPAAARILGHGGTLVQSRGKPLTATAIPAPKGAAAAARRFSIRTSLPRCGHRARPGWTCARVAGHRDEHHSAEQLERSAARRRTTGRDAA